MKICPYHRKTDRVVCEGAGRPYLPSLGEIENFCRRGGYPRCPILAVDKDAAQRQFHDAAYWLLGPAHLT